VARHDIREMKRSLSAGIVSRASEEKRLPARQAALSLLARSVRMGHRRLAVLRLNAAVAAGASVPDDHWRHCRDAALASSDPAIRQLYTASAAAVAKPAASSGKH
jgi:hypothetical protein